MPCCKEATMLVEKQLQHPLPFMQWIGLKMHLLMCVLCRRYEKQSKAIDRYLKELTLEEATTLPEELKKQWEILIDSKLKK